MGNTPWNEAEGTGANRPSSKNGGGYDPYGEAEGRSLLEPPNPYLPVEEGSFGSQSPSVGPAQAAPIQQPTQTPGQAPGQGASGYPQPGSAPAAYSQPGYSQPGYSQPGSPLAPSWSPGAPGIGTPGSGPRQPRRGRGLVIGVASLVVAIAVGVGIYSFATPPTPSDPPTVTASPSSSASSPPATANPPGASSGALPAVWSYEVEDMYPVWGSMAGGGGQGNASYVTSNRVISRFTEDSSDDGGLNQVVGLDAESGDLAWSVALDEARCAAPVTFAGSSAQDLVCSGVIDGETSVLIVDAETGELKQEWALPLAPIGIIHATPAGIVLFTEPDLTTGAAQAAWYTPQGNQTWVVEVNSLLLADDYALEMSEGYEWYETIPYTLDENHVVVHINDGPNALLVSADSQELFSDCRELHTWEDQFICGNRRVVTSRDATGETLWTADGWSFLMDYTRNGSVLMVSSDPYASSIEVRGMDPATGEVVGETATLVSASYGIMTGSADLGIVHGGKSVAAFSPDGPELLWTIELPNDYQREAFPVGEVVLLDGGSNGVYMIDAATGEIRSTWESNDRIVGPWGDRHLVTSGYYDGISMRTLG